MNDPSRSAVAPRLVCEQCRAAYVATSLEPGKAYRCRRCGHMMRYRGAGTPPPRPPTPAAEPPAQAPESRRTIVAAAAAFNLDPADDSDFIQISDDPGLSVSFTGADDDAPSAAPEPPPDGWLVTGFDDAPPSAPAPSPHDITLAADPRALLAAAAARSPGGAAAGAGPNVRMFARYEIHAEIGRGGMGIVYKGRDPGLDRPVAIKTLIGGTAASFGAIKRFEREARTIARLSHPNIVPVYEYGDFEGTRFIVMELVEGTTLADLTKGERGNTRASLMIVAKVARALHYAHEQGIVHRDLKPANVMIDRKREPRVMDFGLAKDLDAEQSRLSQTGDLMGTPNYMAPEQADGRIHEVDKLSDVFSLGAILYEMLAGSPPFHGASLAETLRQVLFEEPPPMLTLNPKLDAELERIALKALDKRRDQRYPSAAELADDIERYLHGERISVAPPSMATRVARGVRRRRAWLRLAAVTVLVLGLAGVAVAWWLRDPLGGTRERLASNEPEVRLRAVESLTTDRRAGRLDEAKRARPVLELLTGALGDPATAVRVAAAKALPSFAGLLDRDRQAAERAALADVFERNLDRDAPPEVRFATLDAIEGLGLTEAQDALMFLVSDVSEPQDVTFRAVQVLSRVGKLSAFPALMQVMNRGGVYRVEAQAAIERLSTPKQPGQAVGIPDSDKVSLGDLPAAIRGFEQDVAGNRARTLQGLEELDMAPSPERESDVLARTLEQGTSSERLGAIYQLSQRRIAGGEAMLLAALGDPDPIVGQAAAAGLVTLGGLGARDELESSLEIGTSRARAAAASGLGQLARPESLNPLLLALEAEIDPLAAVEELRALAAIGDRRAAPHMIEKLADPNPVVKRAARAALTRLAGRDLGESADAWRTWSRG